MTGTYFTLLLPLCRNHQFLHVGQDVFHCLGHNKSTTCSHNKLMAPYLWDVCDFAVPPSLDLSSFAFSADLESSFEARDSLSFDGVLPTKRKKVRCKISLFLHIQYHKLDNKTQTSMGLILVCYTVLKSQDWNINILPTVFPLLVLGICYYIKTISAVFLTMYWW